MRRPTASHGGGDDDGDGGAANFHCSQYSAYETRYFDNDAKRVPTDYAAGERFQHHSINTTQGAGTGCVSLWADLPRRRILAGSACELVSGRERQTDTRCDGGIVRCSDSKNFPGGFKAPCTTHTPATPRPPPRPLTRSCHSSR
eukprot:4129724-Prymnesium_polylepis.1